MSVTPALNKGNCQEGGSYNKHYLFRSDVSINQMKRKGNILGKIALLFPGNGGCWSDKIIKYPL